MSFTRNRQRLLEQRAVLENAILARQLNNPMEDAQGLAALLSAQNQEAQVREGARQFDVGSGFEQNKFNRMQGFDEKYKIAMGKLQEQELGDRRGYYDNMRVASEGQQKLGAKELALRERMGMAEIDQRDQQMDMTRGAQLMGLFGAISELNRQSPNNPVVNPQDANELIYSAFESMGINPRNLPSEQNAALLQGLAESIGQGTQPNTEMLQLMNALNQLRQQKAQPQPARPFDPRPGVPASYVDMMSPAH